MRREVDNELQIKSIEASRHYTTNANKPMPSVTTPPKDAMICAGEPQDATKHDTRKPTPTQDGIFGTDEFRDAIEHMENRLQASSGLSS
jgi:hypothetical protein